MQRRIRDVLVECVKGDITRQADIDIIANAANKQLKGGGGVDGAIHRAAGPELVKASMEQAPIETGQAVITPAFKLPNDWVVHCAGPVYARNKPEVADQLADCYRNALAMGEFRHASSIAFPAISTGVYGYPLDEASRIAVATVIETARDMVSLKKIRFVLFADEDLQVFTRALTDFDASGLP